MLNDHDCKFGGVPMVEKKHLYAAIWLPYVVMPSFSAVLCLMIIGFFLLYASVIGLIVYMPVAIGLTILVWHRSYTIESALELAKGCAALMPIAGALSFGVFQSDDLISSFKSNQMSFIKDLFIMATFFSPLGYVLSIPYYFWLRSYLRKKTSETQENASFRLQDV